VPSFGESSKVTGAHRQLYISVPSGTGPVPAIVVIQHPGGVDDVVELGCWMAMLSIGSKLGNRLRVA
jgi:hypothetical protein